MKKLSCKDIDPSSECDFEATGKTTKEVVDKMMAHAKSEHSEKLKDMDMTDGALRTMMEEKVRDE